MSKVAVVTDSTAYLPNEITRGLPIHTLPLHVIWGEDDLLDGVDISPKVFYERLSTAKGMPTTSQVTPAQFETLYRQLLEEGYDILSIHISGKLSGTLDSATQARSNFPGARITLYDSQSASMAMGFMVLAAARAAHEGATLQECMTITEQACENTNVYFVVSTLEFLRRGGRIGGAQAFLGTALNLKPMLTLHNGRVEAVEKTRTMNKALERMMDTVEKQINGKKPIRLAALHANAPAEATEVLERMRQRFGVSDVADAVLAEVSPAIGTHTGPGTVGLAFMAGM